VIFFLKKNAIPIYIFSFFMIMPLHAVLPVLPLIRDELHASYSEISFFVAGIGIIRLVLAFPSGYLVDRFDKKKMMLFSMPNILIIDIGSPGSVGRLIGINRIFADSGYLIGSVAIGVILDHIGFRMPVYVVAGFGAFTLITIACFIRNKPADL